MKKTVCLCLLVICVAVFAVCAWMLTDYFLESKRSRDLYDDLAQMVEQGQQKEPTVREENPASPTTAEEEKAPSSAILPEYEALYRLNPDLAGWITVPGTKINYPVMQTPDDPDYYLHRGFDREEAAGGCLYVQSSCDVNRPSDNVVIYGHNMKDGSMFGELERYQDETFWEAHRRISFHTMTQRREYEVAAVFRTFVYSDSEESFKYYRFVDADTEEDFDRFVQRCRELSLYETGVDVQFGDKLITLSTCEYTRKNGRFVVVARLLEDAG